MMMMMMMITSQATFFYMNSLSSCNMVMHDLSQ